MQQEYEVVCRLVELLSGLGTSGPGSRAFVSFSVRSIFLNNLVGLIKRLQVTDMGWVTMISML